MTTATPDVVADISYKPSDPIERKSARTILTNVMVWTSLMVVVVASLHYGFQLRKWTWELTAPIRFTPDITRGYGWGYEAATNGYVNLYEKMSPQEPRWGNWLDYAPLRLAVMRMWAVTNIARYGDDAATWRNEWEFNKPVLLFNMGMELLAAACAFLLTRLWVRRSTSNPSPYCGWFAGLIAALLFWFSPAVLLSAHGWPTWDMWIIPMYLLAVLLASCNWWFAAGLAVAVGAMFKGQQLAVATVFLVWPLFLLRFDAMLKWTIGLVFGIGVLALPWLLTYVPSDAIAAMRAVQFNGRAEPWDASRLNLPARSIDAAAVTWIGLLVITTVAGPLLLRRLRNRFATIPSLATAQESTESLTVLSYETPRPIEKYAYRLICAASGVAAFMVAFWPWFLPNNRQQWWIGLAFSCSVATLVVIVRRLSHVLLLTCATIGTSLIATMWFFHGSDAWWVCGWKYGTIHWPGMIMGLTSNLPGILVNRYGWRNPEMPVDALTIPAPFLFGWPKAVLVPTIGQVLKMIFAIMLALSAIGIGLQARRRDPRILVAFATPWLVFFSFPTQIHERYLLYAAGVAAVAIGTGTGPALLGVLMSVITFLMTIHVMLAHGDRDALGALLAEKYPSLFSRDAGNTFKTFIDGTFPDVGWAVLLITAIFLYFSLAPSARDRRPRLLSD